MDFRWCASLVDSPNRIRIYLRIGRSHPELSDAPSVWAQRHVARSRRDPRAPVSGVWSHLIRDDRHGKPGAPTCRATVSTPENPFFRLWSESAKLSSAARCRDEGE